MNKISSYQKLKIENQKLKEDIYNLIVNENTENGLLVKLCYKIKFDIDKVLMLGESTKPNDNEKR